MTTKYSKTFASKFPIVVDSVVFSCLGETNGHYMDNFTVMKCLCRFYSFNLCITVISLIAVL